jgi:hypothetical protein
VTHWQMKVLKKLGKLKEGDAIYVRKTTTSIEMDRKH